MQATRIDINELQRLVEQHPREFDKLLGKFGKSGKLTMQDRYGRRIAKMDKVITPQFEYGVVIRLDVNSDRVLVRLDAGGTRMLKCYRLETVRGRPRKDSLRTA